MIVQVRSNASAKVKENIPIQELTASASLLVGEEQKKSEVNRWLDFRYNKDTEKPSSWHLTVNSHEQFLRHHDFLYVSYRDFTRLVLENQNFEAKQIMSRRGNAFRFRRVPKS